MLHLRPPVPVSLLRSLFASNTIDSLFKINIYLLLVGWVSSALSGRSILINIFWNDFAEIMSGLSFAIWTKTGNKA